MRSGQYRGDAEDSVSPRNLNPYHSPVFPTACSTNVLNRRFAGLLDLFRKQRRLSLPLPNGCGFETFGLARQRKLPVRRAFGQRVLPNGAPWWHSGPEPRCP